VEPSSASSSGRPASAYLDHGALGALDPRVARAVSAALAAGFGDPSARHAPGRRARAALDEARARVGRLIDGAPEGVVFTSGATEAVNLALRGLAARAGGGHVVASTADHVSVLTCCRHLLKHGWAVTLLGVDADGRVDPAAVAAAVRDDTAVVSLGAANGEIGTVQPIREIARLTRARGIPLHVDAVHALGRVPLGVTEDQVDLLSLSSSDLHGPPGAGALWVRPRLQLAPVLLGGGQEGGYRAGTENLHGIIGLGVAAELAWRERDRDIPRVAQLRDRLLSALLAQVPGARLLGPAPPARLPHHASILVPAVKAEAVLMELDLRGVAASSGSACATLTGEPSHVLRAIGVAPEDAEGSLVFTLGRSTTGAEVDHATAAVVTAVARLRALAGR
jgi:cysteine desulfurase